MKKYIPNNTIEIRPDNPAKGTVPPEPLPLVDEVVIGNWLHLERMDGVNKRIWCLIITDQKGDTLNISIVETNGTIKKAVIVEQSSVWGK